MKRFVVLAVMAILSTYASAQTIAPIVTYGGAQGAQPGVGMLISTQLHGWVFGVEPWLAFNRVATSPATNSSVYNQGSEFGMNLWAGLPKGDITWFAIIGESGQTRSLVTRDDAQLLHSNSLSGDAWFNYGVAALVQATSHFSVLLGYTARSGGQLGAGLTF